MRFGACFFDPVVRQRSTSLWLDFRVTRCSLFLSICPVVSFYYAEIHSALYQVCWLDSPAAFSVELNLIQDAVATLSFCSLVIIFENYHLSFFCFRVYSLSNDGKMKAASNIIQPFIFCNIYIHRSGNMKDKNALNTLLFVCSEFAEVLVAGFRL